jgi:DNA invertase Pin-like site-specific DNA recombinase
VNIHNEIRNKEIIKLYTEGKTLRYISNLYNISTTTVGDVLRYYKIQRRSVSDYKDTNKLNRVTRANINKIIVLYNTGLTLSEVGKIYNVSGVHIGKIIREAGINTREKQDTQKLHTTRNIDIKELCQDYINELMTNDICKKWNINRCILYRVLRDNNISIRKDRTSISMKCSCKSRLYTLPSSAQIYIQGYEDHFLDFIFNNKLLNEKDIVYRPPTIRYKDINNINRLYYPDFYIPKLNLIVEIKSLYILNIQTRENFECKKKACMDNGYNFLCILDKNYEELLNILKGI